MTKLSRSLGFVVGLGLGGSLGCTPLKGAGPSSQPAARATSERSEATGQEDEAPKVAAIPGGWATVTSSPRPGVPDPADAKIAKLCGGGADAALLEVARHVATVLAETGNLPDAQTIEWLQRRAGNPHVWPRTFGVVGQGLDRKSLMPDVTKWVGGAGKNLRCGVALARAGDGKTSALVVVGVEPIADLDPLPTHVPIGSWLDVGASLQAGTKAARVVLLPPVGAPRTVLSNVSPSGTPRLRSRIQVAQRGRWVIQVLADDMNGPRPVLEAEVYAGVEPPNAPPSPAVPGEEAGDGDKDPTSALYRRLNGTRAAEGLPKLVRSDRLEALAAAHARAMMERKVLGHDVGDGDPAARVAASGLKLGIIGENVAKASSERAAHRALYASPSHRGNMLERRFRQVGIAAVVDPATEQVWVAQLFGG